MKTLTLFFDWITNVFTSITDAFTSFTINFPVIWSDSSIYVCLWLVMFCIIVVWAANNYRRSICEEYLVKTTSKLCALNDEIDKQKSEYKFLDNAFAEYRTDAQSEMFERQERINQLKSQVDAEKQWNKQIREWHDELKISYSELKSENIELRTKLQGRRNPDGTFAKTTGKGHGRKKPAPEPERDWTTATPDELLAEAKRRYPVGTRYADILDAWKYEAKREPWIYTYAQTFKGIAICVTDGGGFVYANGRWAQILP